jgi:hypothetical protein
MNIANKLKKLEERLQKKLEIDPEVAIKMIGKFIDLACGEGKASDDEKIALYDFVWWVNQFMSVEPSDKKIEVGTGWRETEALIVGRGGFKVDSRDIKAESIREFKV